MKKNIAIILCLAFLSVSLWANNDSNLSFTMYPVPLKGSILTVEITATFTSIASFELRNLVGKKLQEKKILQGNTKIIFEDMDMYPSGLYVIAAKDANGKILETSKFIITK